MRDHVADGLRGVAAFNVVLAHFIAALWPALLRNNYQNLETSAQPLTTLERLLSSPPVTLLFNGHFAVVIFFVISGYVLAQHAPGDYSRIRSRFWARYLRLNIPIAAACLLSWLFLINGAYSHVEAGQASGSAWLGRYVNSDVGVQDLARILFTGGILGDGTLIPPLWTLKVEFVGSLLLLATLALAPPGREKISLVAVACFLLLFQPADFVYFLCIFAGAALNSVGTSRPAAIILAALGLLLGAFQPDIGFYSMLPPVTEHPKDFYNAVGAVCIVAGVCRAHVFSHLFESAPIRYLGRISYALYLVHFISLCSVASIVVLNFGTGWKGISLAFVAYIALSILIAEAFTRYVDKPAIKLGHRFARFVSGDKVAIGRGRPAASA